MEAEWSEGRAHDGVAVRVLARLAIPERESGQYIEMETEFMKIAMNVRGDRAEISSREIITNILLLDYPKINIPSMRPRRIPCTFNVSHLPIPHRTPCHHMPATIARPAR